MPLGVFKKPKVFNATKNSQFTSAVFAGGPGGGRGGDLDGRVAADGMDSVFIERLWRSFKYEAVYLHELTDGFHAERIISEWATSIIPSARVHLPEAGCRLKSALWPTCGYDKQG